MRWNKDRAGGSTRYYSRRLDHKDAQTVAAEEQQRMQCRVDETKTERVCIIAKKRKNASLSG
jgi:hypothetical protein